tara:strand:+ start:749 stop:2155 length:1407 start_codon:yes stop_codon:yes gene_type:complete
MALQLRRGTNAQRLAITPAEGELIYVTNSVALDVSPLWVGDGTTVGGIAATADTLAALNDVNVATQAEGDILYYDATTSKWRNTPILSIDDSGAVAINVNGTGISTITLDNPGTGTWNAPGAPLILRHTAGPGISVGFGTTLTYEAETPGSGTVVSGYNDVQMTDSTTGSEDFQWGIGLMKNGVAPSSSGGGTPILRQFVINSTGDTQITGNLTLNRDEDNASSVIYAKSTGADSTLTWDGTNWTFADPIIAKTSLKLNGSTSNSITLSAGASPAVQTYTLPAAYPASNGYILSSQTDGILSWVVDANSGGDVVGPASATDNAVARFNLTTGKIIKNSGVIIDDSNNVSGAVDVGATTLTLGGVTTQKVNQNSQASTTPTAVMTTTKSSMKVVIRLKDNVTSNVHVCEALLVAVDATTALITVYAEMYNSVSLATFTTDVSSGSLRLIMTPASANSTTYSILANDLGT